MIRRALATAALLSIALAACTKPVPPVSGTSAAASPAGPERSMTYEQEIRDWQEHRIERLKKPGGWLSMAGLFWLKDGANAAGSDPLSPVALPAGVPKKVGALTLKDHSVMLALEPGVAATVDGKAVSGTLGLRSDIKASEPPTKVAIGAVTFWVIERAGRLGVRVTDDSSHARESFKGIEMFPVDAKWKVTARWEKFAKPKKVQIPTVIDGVFEEYEMTGAAVFTLDGKEYRLEPVIEDGDTDFFFVFKDATAGHETYGAGRFLYATPPVTDTFVIDFNKAYNPPCALTPYATCPLPLPENVLTVRIEAGEKKTGSH